LGVRPLAPPEMNPAFSGQSHDRSLATTLQGFCKQADAVSLAQAYASSKFDVNSLMFVAVTHGSYKPAERVGNATLLHVAAAAHAADIVKWLLNHGADVGALDGNGQTALEVAQDAQTRLLLSRAALARAAPKSDTISSGKFGEGGLRAESLSYGGDDAYKTAVTELDLEALGFGPMSVLGCGLITSMTQLNHLILSLAARKLPLRTWK
jgi:hypothetical protein